MVLILRAQAVARTEVKYAYWAVLVLYIPGGSTFFALGLIWDTV